MGIVGSSKVGCHMAVVELATKELPPISEAAVGAIDRIVEDAVSLLLAQEDERVIERDLDVLITQLRVRVGSTVRDSGPFADSENTADSENAARCRWCGKAVPEWPAGWRFSDDFAYCPQHKDDDDA